MKKIKRIYCPCCNRVIQHYDNNCPECHENLNIFWIQKAIEFNQKNKTRKQRKLRKLRVKKLNKINQYE